MQNSIINNKFNIFLFFKEFFIFISFSVLYLSYRYSSTLKMDPNSFTVLRYNDVLLLLLLILFLIITKLKVLDLLTMDFIKVILNASVIITFFYILILSFLHIIANVINITMLTIFIANNQFIICTVFYLVVQSFFNITDFGNSNDENSNVAKGFSFFLPTLFLCSLVDLGAIWLFLIQLNWYFIPSFILNNAFSKDENKKKTYRLLTILFLAPNLILVTYITTLNINALYDQILKETIDPKHMFRAKFAKISSAVAKVTLRDAADVVVVGGGAAAAIEFAIKVNTPSSNATGGMPTPVVSHTLSIEQSAASATIKEQQDAIKRDDFNKRMAASRKVWHERSNVSAAAGPYYKIVNISYSSDDASSIKNKEKN